MAVTRDSFKARFPEFNLDDGGADATQNALIDAVLLEAEGQTDRTLFQTSTNADTAVKLLAAHLLACSPAGLKLRLAKEKNGKLVSSYLALREIMITGVAVGHRVP